MIYMTVQILHRFKARYRDRIPGRKFFLVYKCNAIEELGRHLKNGEKMPNENRLIHDNNNTIQVISDWSASNLKKYTLSRIKLLRTFKF